MAVFAMPSLGADMEAGTLIEWMIKPGDTVTRGDVVAVVETQKGAIEIECFEEGTVESLDAEIGTTLAVGTPLATIRGPGEDTATTARLAAEPEAPTKPEAEANAPAQSARPAEEPAPMASTPVTMASAPTVVQQAGQAPSASPAARVRAAELRIDLASLFGTGPGGAILLEDVEAAEPAPVRDAPAKASAKPGLDMAAMRKAIANAMARSKREIPHYYLTQTIDLQAAINWLAATNAERTPDKRLLTAALFVKASALAASQVAQMNGHYDAEGFHAAKSVNAGVAVALRGGGLVAPALHDAETLPLDTLMARMRDLVVRARSGRLRSTEMTDGTITISAMGDTGADAMAAVIYPPQVAIVGFGAPVARPWIIGDTITPRMTVTVTLSADHRVSDGRRGAKFLAAIDAALQTPEAL
ncbi:pyruvate dehydrogenase E2 component (dihydrolipoamide acetyltransferase) [Jannaschia faecimaris]|uniref:Dihydrolipoamide acetyltransferase component of pyruvate dehydrogenase complex n=1 Tax=Jannaschia faecimaris TaxID=1244108 RepID=A0A1H3UH31_9RHOB|nr:dihydrolipoamide acetyltransferase family protein [Jannaschia faecimaris]SDZ61718.1 pyruvate dehydrogenase E2 component (dihydrolipoamide acetyltransferase) [Jannaschia faecimaris]